MPSYAGDAIDENGRLTYLEIYVHGTKCCHSSLVLGGQGIHPMPHTNLVMECQLCDTLGKAGFCYSHEVGSILGSRTNFEEQSQSRHLQNRGIGL